MGIKRIAMLFLVFACTVTSAFAAKKTKFFELDIRPLIPQATDDITIYAAAKTDFTSSTEQELLTEFYWDNILLTAEILAPKLWTLKLSAPHAGGAHVFKAKLFIQDKVKAKELSARIKELDQEVLALEAQLVNTTDENERDTIQSEIANRESTELLLKQELAELPRFIGEDEHTLSLPGENPIKNLLKTLVNAEGHHVAIQNNDFGWDIKVEDPGDLGDRTNSSPQFGVSGQGMLDAHKVTGHKYYATYIGNTAYKIYTRPVGVKVGAKAASCTYLVGMDSVYIGSFGLYANDYNYRIKALESAAQFKTCLKALHVVGTTNDEDDALDLVDPADLANVTNLEAAQKFLEYLIAKNVLLGQRSLDLLNRFEEALIVQDRDFAFALAKVAATEALSLTPTAPHFLLGSGTIIEMLNEFKNDDTSFPGLISTLGTELLTHQRPDGRFEYWIDPETFGGGDTQDNAFVLRALLAVGGQEVAIDKLLDAFYNLQQWSGGYYINGYEFVQGQAELMTAMSKAAIAKGLILYGDKRK